MPRVDQFESVFRAAARVPFHYGRPEIGKILVVADLPADEARAFARKVRDFLNVFEADDATSWIEIQGEDFKGATELLSRVNEISPDLVCTYRNLHSDAWRHHPYTLGEHLDVLTQATEIPILVLPHPEGDRAAAHAHENTDVVMAVTSHLTGDERLVNHAARFTHPGGTLYLTHIEDDHAFEKTMEAISKIPSIDTDDAREKIAERLLKDPRDYIEDCKRRLSAAGLTIEVREIVAFGHRMDQYKRLIEEHEVDLLVFHTKDKDQLAMHGLAYPLAVELRQIPLLMI